MKRVFKRSGILLFFVALIFVHGALAQKTKPQAKPTPTPKPPATSNSALNQLETDVLSEVQSLRANPASYIKYLEAMRGKFKGNFETLDGGVQMATAEGVAGVDDAIAALKSTKPLPAFKLSNGLSKAAADHLNDMVKNNSEGHKGTDGTWPPNRVDRYGTWAGQVKENISYHAQTAREIVLNMVIDDGNPKRDHRKNLLSRDLNFVGIDSGMQKTGGQLCVVVFAAQFVENVPGKARAL